jgi:hypothetical protein
MHYRTTPKQYSFLGIHDSTSSDLHIYVIVSTMNHIHVWKTITDSYVRCTPFLQRLSYETQLQLPLFSLLLDLYDL